MAKAHYLRAGHTLSVTVNEGRAHVRSSDGLESTFTRSSVSYGPYLVDRDYLIDGDVTVTIAAYTSALNAAVLTNAGAPDDAARATLAVDPDGDDNALTFTARVYGAEGNSITVAYVDPSANDAVLSVAVFRQAITVSLATGEAGAITSTAAEVLAAIEANGLAHQLVTVAIVAGDGEGSSDDGSGVVTAMAAAALAGGAGTAIGTVQAGGLLIDTTGGKQYRNVGTPAVPVWVSPQDLHLYGAGAPVDYTDGDPVATGEGTAWPGALYSDITNANVYRNDGSRAQPAWVQLADAS